ncbi:MAG: nucleoside diphosphate kinase regulator [Anaerolineae bacterium]|nr:nucleoside diphosphate kinase regulator [Anaerolineae bacterium]
MNSKAIQITELDFDRLQRLVEEAAYTDLRGRDYLARLQSELKRAQVVPPEAVSDVVITMNSTVVLLDMDTHQEETYTLVFPENADADRGYISVLAPVGMAMMGYQVGDTFEWPVPEGMRRLLVKEVLYQPEAAGDYHL